MKLSSWLDACVEKVALVLFIVGAFNCAHTNAGGLDDWLASIDEVSPRVKAARATWEVTRAAVPMAAGWMDPVIGVDVERNNTRLSDYDMLEYMIEQELPWPGSLGAKKEVARLEAEAQGFEMLEVRRQVRADITGSFWMLWAERESVVLAQAQADLLDTLADATQARMASGQASQAEWLRIRIERDRMRNDIITMERDADLALAMLNAHLNADPNTPRATDTMPPLPVMDASLEQLQRDARMYCCILMATLWREMAKDLDRKATRLEQRPSISLRVEARQMRDSGSIDEFDTGIAMSVPWLWGGKYRGRKAEAEANYQMASAELEKEIAMTLVDIQELYVRADSKLRAIHLLEESILPQTRALAQSSREVYPAGMMSAMEMLDAQKMMIETEMNYLREKAAYAKTHAKLMAIAQPWTEDEVETGLPVHVSEAMYPGE